MQRDSGSQGLRLRLPPGTPLGDGFLSLRGGRFGRVAEGLGGQVGCSRGLRRLGRSRGCLLRLESLQLLLELLALGLAGLQLLLEPTKLLGSSSGPLLSEASGPHPLLVFRRRVKQRYPGKKGSAS